MSVPRWGPGVQGDWPEVALGGRSNVGKSSLLNALLGRRSLARTSSTPGRTQALNYFVVDERFVLVDLPGYGYARAPRSERERWAAATRQYLEGAPGLRAVVLLADIRRDPTAEDRAFAALVRRAGRPLVVAVTKSDKVRWGRRAERLRAIGEGLGEPVGRLVVTSSRTGEGRDQVWERVLGLLERGDGDGGRGS